MRSLVSYFDCGNIIEYDETIYFRIEKFKDLTDKVIPYFDKYPIIGVKSQDFEDFKRVTELMKNRAHLTYEGLDQIKKN